MDVTTLASLEALRSCQGSLEEIIANLLALLKSMPEGNYRDGLFEQISCLDSISDVMRQALDSCRSR